LTLFGEAASDKKGHILKPKWDEKFYPKTPYIKNQNETINFKQKQAIQITILKVRATEKKGGEEEDGR
jgi:hypothetical protein